MQVSSGVIRWLIAGVLLGLSVIVSTCQVVKAESYPYVEYIETVIDNDEPVNVYVVHCG